MQKISTCLWFDGWAEEAMTFYTSIFKNSKAGQVPCYGDAGPGEKGSVMTATFELEGRAFMALNGGPAFAFTPAVSLVVNCETQDELDTCWARLLEVGTPQQCGWLSDKFGLSSQIVPTILPDLVRGDAARANRVMQALMKMVKLDIEGLKQAAQAPG
jgi:predicted 3-demethylubiquinone-9 3-methyltransferase (glyoxalase superfamily)